MTDPFDSRIDDAYAADEEAHLFESSRWDDVDAALRDIGWSADDLWTRAREEGVDTTDVDALLDLIPDAEDVE